jgi:hypothetical protein
MQRVRDLAHQRLVAPAGAVLDDHQPQVDRHRQRRSTLIAGRPVPVALERLEDRRIGQQRVEPSPVLGQSDSLGRKQAVPDRGDGMCGGESQHGGLPERVSRAALLDVL